MSPKEMHIATYSRDTSTAPAEALYLLYSQVDAAAPTTKEYRHEEGHS